MIKMCNKYFCRILAILAILLMVVSCIALPSSMAISEGEVTTLTSTGYVPNNNSTGLTFSAYYQPINISVNLSVPPYQLPLNLSNITNIGDITSGFRLNKIGKDVLVNNGFVIVDYGSVNDIVEPYEDIRVKGVPIFVTSDTLLQLYHVQFDEILKGIEERAFFDELLDVSKTMFDQSTQDYERFTEPKLCRHNSSSRNFFRILKQG